MNDRPADATGGEQEPVHEDTSAVIVRVIGQQPVPLVLLLTGAVSVTPQGGGHSENRGICHVHTKYTFHHQPLTSRSPGVSPAQTPCC